MHTTITSVPSAHDPGLPVARKLIDSGGELGALMRRVSYLAESVRHASDDVTTQDERSRTQLDRMLVFVEMMEETADKASEVAEEVEQLGLGQFREAL
jgi:hypothetical protein